MNAQNLLERISETLLWEVVSSCVEQCEQLPVMLNDIDYLEDKSGIIAKAVRCEITESDSFDTFDCTDYVDSLYVSFEMPFVLSVRSAESKPLVKVTATATGQCFMHDCQSPFWQNTDFDDMNKQELLSYKHLVNVTELRYSNVECDDLTHCC